MGTKNCDRNGNFFSDVDIPKLPAYKSMQSDKSPGSNGLTK